LQEGAAVEVSAKLAMLADAAKYDASCASSGVKRWSQSPPLVREHRLYQADGLMRFYGFAATEITTETALNLDLSIDPKYAWALRHRVLFPVDVNWAERAMLLRMPGMGVRSVNRILQLRRQQAVRVMDLKRLRVLWRQAAPFVVTADFNPEVMQLDRVDLAVRTAPRDRQLELFAAARAAEDGEL